MNEKALEPSTEGPFLLAIRGKVLAAFLLGGFAFVIALSIIYFSFRGLLTTVDELASPNEKLKTLHQFFQRVAQLDQQQRAEAISNPSKPYADFLKESRALFSVLDTLQSMDWKDSVQAERLHAMEEILKQRDKLFLSYLKFRGSFIVNRTFSKKLDSLSVILSNAKIWADSNIITTQRRIITTTTQGPDKVKEKRFLSRLFRKKEEKVPDTKIEVKEELNIKIDTLAVAQRDSGMLAVDRVMKNMDADQRAQTKNMLQRELELINANTVLVNQLLTILHETEEEELSTMHSNTTGAVQLVNTSIKRIALIMIVFFIVAAVLIFLIYTDITRTNFYRLQLLKAKEEAEYLGKVKQRFLANMSHEIRTPLQSIIGYSEHLQKTHLPDAEAITAIHASSEHLLHIVNEILDYSRIESGKFTLENEPFSIVDILHEVSSVMRVQASQRNLSFTLNADNVPDVMVSGDAFRLRQILYNVLGNAIKFTEKGDVKLIVQTEDREHAMRCLFSITDTGVGMSAEEIARVFEQFEQANAAITRQYGGTGLGLTIVKTLVEAQGGKLLVESEQGKGTTFRIDLTFKKASAEKREFNHDKRGVRRLPEGKVLIVDDDPLILRLCTLMLEKNHIPYYSFQDAEKVLEATLDDVLLVFLDIRMPHVNGIELCGELRKKLKKEARIIALTAHVLPQERQDLLDGCFDDMLTKPFHEREFLELIGINADELSSPSPSAIDLEAVRKMTMGDDDLFQSIVTQFIEETSQDLINLAKNIHDRNALLVREIVHKLAGRIGQMGMRGLADDFKKLERHLHEGRDVSSLVNELATAIEHLQKAITSIKTDTEKISSK